MARTGTESTKLQAARQKKGYTQKQLAVVTDISVRTIQCYERKARDIDGAGLETLCDLSIALDCKIEDIIESEELIEKFRLAK